jgi:hypothetical protein
MLQPRGLGWAGKEEDMITKADVLVKLTPAQQDALLWLGGRWGGGVWADIAGKVKAARDITLWEVDSGLPAEDH